MTVFDTKVFGFLWYAYTAEQTEKHTAIGHNAYSSCASWSFRNPGAAVYFSSQKPIYLLAIAEKWNGYKFNEI